MLLLLLSFPFAFLSVFEYDNEEDFFFVALSGSTNSPLKVPPPPLFKDTAPPGYIIMSRSERERTFSDVWYAILLSLFFLTLCSRRSIDRSMFARARFLSLPRFWFLNWQKKYQGEYRALGFNTLKNREAKTPNNKIVTNFFTFRARAVLLLLLASPFSLSLSLCQIQTRTVLVVLRLRV
jgi:hypothetical protein